MIKWTGRDTHGNMTWRFEEDTMLELYEVLVSKDIIDDNYERYQFEKIGIDIDDIVELAYNEDIDYREYIEANFKLDSLTDEEIECLILECDGNAYYQTFEII